MWALDTMYYGVVRFTCRFFFFNDTATTEIYTYGHTLSLHDALPISAKAAAEPPLEPPGVRSKFQGLRVMPYFGLSVTAFQPNSGVVVLPRKMAPLSRARATAGESSVHG